MSENKSKTQSNTSSLIATIIVAAVAVALAIIAVVTLNGSDEDTSASSTAGTVSFSASAELVDECEYAAHDLIEKNIEIIRLFITEGLHHYDEPYGNLPEDGIYTVNSTDYTSLEQIEELVHSAFVNAEAERILTNIDGNGLAVYQNREILVDAVYTDEATSESAESRPLYTTETVLGISADFVPDSDYDKDWSCSIAVSPVSETQCELTIYLGGLGDGGVDDVDPENILETAMVKIDGEWKLSVFVY